MFSKYSLVALGLVGAVGCSSPDDETVAAEGNALSASAGADAADPAATVLLVHGFHSQISGGAWNCNEFWKNQKDLLRGAGFRGPILTAGYYSANTNCDRQASDRAYTKDGDVTLERGDARNALTNATPIEHAAYRLAWVVASEHAANAGHSVRIVADSLGGVVVRWLVTQSSLGNPSFPTLQQLGLSRVYAYGAPYEGANLASLGWWPQAQQVKPDSDLIRTLRTTGRVGSARWVAFTSNRTSVPTRGDGFISNDSACAGSTCYRFESPNYVHGSYALDTDDAVKVGAYRVRQASGAWGPLVTGPGAPTIVANALVR